MRKCLAIVGDSEEALALIPLLEANPEVEVGMILCEDRARAIERLRRIAPGLEARFEARITDEAGALAEGSGFEALIDGRPSGAAARVLQEAEDRGLPVRTPLLARLLYAYAAGDRTPRAELLRGLTDVLESYELASDRTALAQRILEVSARATGARRASLLRADPSEGTLTAQAVLGVDPEILSRIRIAPGEGIAGRALLSRETLLIEDRADPTRFRITHPREDLRSAIVTPLIHDGRALGVLNLARGREQEPFGSEDVAFVERLGELAARFLARAEEHARLVHDSLLLRARDAVQRCLRGEAPLSRRLSALCTHVAQLLAGGLCHLYLYDRDLERLVLWASSSRIDALAAPLRIPVDQGIQGRVARLRKEILLRYETDGLEVGLGVAPLVHEGELIGVLSWETAEPCGRGTDTVEEFRALALALAEELGTLLHARRIDREGTQTQAVSEFAARLRLARNPAELHRLTTRSAAMLLEAEHAILRLRDASSGHFQIRSYFGSADTDAQAALFSLEKKLSIEAIKTRGPVRIIDFALRADLASPPAGPENALVQPLCVGDQVTGTLSVLGKGVQDPLLGESFNCEDQTVLARLAVSVADALETAQERDHSRHRQRFDELTALPNAASLREHLEHEIARASAHGRRFALIHLRLAGLAGILATDREAGDRIVLSLAQDLRGGLREFDVVARSSPDGFDILIPEPDVEIPNLIGPLASRVREAIRRGPAAELASELRLHFGYGLFPEDSRTAAGLLERARSVRVTND